MSLVLFNALRYYPTVSKAKDKKETNNHPVLCFVEKKRQTDSMHLCGIFYHFWVVYQNIKEL